MLNYYFKVPFADTGDKLAVPQATQPDGSVSFNTGWGPDYELPYSNPNSKDIPRDQSNQLSYAITKALQEYQQGGVPDWIDPSQNGGVNFTYAKGSRVRWSDGNVYIAQVATLATPGASADWLLDTPHPKYGVVGAVRTLRASLAAAGASITFTADEILVKAAFGSGAATTLLSGFNKVLNISTVGAGGMDVGAATASSFVAIYAIYNPTTGVSALLARTAAVLRSEIYDGANMPAGYTQSALLSVWQTSAGALLNPGYQTDRRLSFVGINVNSTSTAAASPTPFSVATAVPANAKRCRGYAGYQSTVTTSSVALALGGSNLMFDVISGQTFGSGSISYDIQMPTPQQLHYQASIGSGSFGANVFVGGYEI